LIYGEFKIIFPLENREVVLSEEGDYVFFDSGVPHTWKTNKDTLLLTLRWPSLANDQKAIS
jgi:quercetin dioxygenase-like cupin family protein